MRRTPETSPEGIFPPRESQEDRSRRTSQPGQLPPTNSALRRRIRRPSATNPDTTDFAYTHTARTSPAPHSFAHDRKPARESATPAQSATSPAQAIARSDAPARNTAPRTRTPAAPGFAAPLATTQPWGPPVWGTLAIWGGHPCLPFPPESMLRAASTTSSTLI